MGVNCVEAGLPHGKRTESAQERMPEVPGTGTVGMVPEAERGCRETAEWHAAGSRKQSREMPEKADTDAGSGTKRPREEGLEMPDSKRKQLFSCSR